MVELSELAERRVAEIEPSEGKVELVTVLKAVADHNRLAILGLLRKEELCVCELVEVLQLPQNLVSHHLSVLKKAGLVASRRDQDDSRWIYYSLNREALAAHFQAYELFFDPCKAVPELDGIDREAIAARWQQSNTTRMTRRATKRQCPR
ncbi:MAG: metalloregulator ArsR/SmtB family transcription factor [Chloroflexi bacterium]|nr:metalloregulator ArsR/SmtB family transcription factor [Chloroflexota bacterium]MDA8186757.1 metalloregulator ArsR/SmtB family transcription factor [Dehalococcoidales bacterium]